MFCHFPLKYIACKRKVSHFHFTKMLIWGQQQQRWIFCDKFCEEQKKRELRTRKRPFCAEKVKSVTIKIFPVQNNLTLNYLLLLQSFHKYNKREGLQAQRCAISMSIWIWNSAGWLTDTITGIKSRDIIMHLKSINSIINYTITELCSCILVRKYVSYNVVQRGHDEYMMKYMKQWIYDTVYEKCINDTTIW